MKYLVLSAMVIVGCVDSNVSQQHNKGEVKEVLKSKKEFKYEVGQIVAHKLKPDFPMLVVSRRKAEKETWGEGIKRAVYYTARYYADVPELFQRGRLHGSSDKEQTRFRCVDFLECELTEYIKVIK